MGCGGTGVELKEVLRGGRVGQRWAVVEQRTAGTQKELYKYLHTPAGGTQKQTV